MTIRDFYLIFFLFAFSFSSSYFLNFYFRCLVYLAFLSFVRTVRQSACFGSIRCWIRRNHSLPFLVSFLISTQSSIYMFFSWFGQLFRSFFHFFIFYDRISLAITKNVRKRRNVAVQNDKYSKTGKKPGIQFNFILFFCKIFFFACGTVCSGWKQIILKGTIREERVDLLCFRAVWNMKGVKMDIDIVTTGARTKEIDCFERSINDNEKRKIHKKNGNKPISLYKSPFSTANLWG